MVSNWWPCFLSWYNKQVVNWLRMGRSITMCHYHFSAAPDSYGIMLSMIIKAEERSRMIWLRCIVNGSWWSSSIEVMIEIIEHVHMDSIDFTAIPRLLMAWWDEIPLAVAAVRVPPIFRLNPTAIISSNDEFHHWSLNWQESGMAILTCQIYYWHTFELA